MNYDYNLEEIKESLSLSDIESILIEFEAEPEVRNETIVSRTVCHNQIGEGSHKLYYYNNSKLFHCYTGCDGEGTFDIFELIRKVMSREHPKEREDPSWNLPEAVEWIARKFGYAPNIKDEENEISIKEDLTILSNYDRIKDININNQQIELKEYQANFLKFFPKPRLEIWEREGISREVMDYHNICFDAKNQGIVIPHYDINNRLIGIRERTIVKENEIYGKYRPAYIGGKMYNHPLGYNLYNLNNVKTNIQRMRKVFVFESEKSCLKYASYFGKENDLSVACCGSSFGAYQAWLLINQNAEEIIMGLDHDFTDLKSDEAKKIIKNLKNIHNKFSAYVKISFLWDSKNRLGYKESPIDGTPELFQELFKERIMIYE